MKIEKLTDNKIRVIINSDELGLNHANVHHIMVKTITSSKEEKASINNLQPSV